MLTLAADSLACFDFLLFKCFVATVDVQKESVVGGFQLEPNRRY